MPLRLGQRLPAVRADEIGGIGDRGAAARAGAGDAVAPDLLLHESGRGGLVLILRVGPGQVGAAGEADEIVLLDRLATVRAGQGRHVSSTTDGLARELQVPWRAARQRPRRGPDGTLRHRGVHSCHPRTMGAHEAARGNMISYELDDEHAELRRTVEEFARDVVAPVIGGYYERGEFPYEIVSRMGKLGLFGLPFPEESGGMGGDHFALCLAIEELARVDSSVAITLEAAVCLGAMPIYEFGTDEQRAKWLPDLCSGARLAAFGLTEPGGGSDIRGGMRTVARLDGGEWVIDGSKAFITNAGTSITSVVTPLAITGTHADGSREISAIIVSADTDGFTVGQEYSKVGWCAS